LLLANGAARSGAGRGRLAWKRKGSLPSPTSLAGSIAAAKAPQSPKQWEREKEKRIENNFLGNNDS